MPRLRDTVAAIAIALAYASVASAQTVETSLPGVTATVTSAHQYDGMLHIGVTLKNPTDRDASQSQGMKFAEIVLVDAAGARKHFAVKDVDNHFLAGPISDWNDGGRWFPQVPPHSEIVVWALFEAVPAGAKLSLEIPQMGTLEGIAVAEGPPPASKRLASSQRPFGATLVSASRTPGQLTVQIRLDNPDSRAATSGAALAFRDVYALDAAGKRKFPLLKSQTGQYQAEPHSDNNDGGRLFLANKVQPGGQALLTLRFQPPPDSVKTVDVVLPFFPPFEATSVSGSGGAGAGGVAVAGRSEALEQAMKDLSAAETPKEIKVNLSADVLFDFDKADLKPQATPSLQRLATVISAYPTAEVSVEGHTDGKGTDAYNQPLSERRAAAVGNWLTVNAGLAASRLHTRAWGKTRPMAPNTKPDGSDDPEGRAKNRRVEITVTK